MLTALIAEDEMLVRMGISSSVPWSELNIAVVGEARDGQEAWELYQKYRPDIVILDLLMPKLSGVELLERIRRSDPRCAAIVVTGVDQGETLDRIKGLGISAILHKMTMKRDDINEAVRGVCDALRPARSDSAPQAMREQQAWEDFLFGSAPDALPFEAQGMIALRLFPNDKLTPTLRHSLSMLITKRLGETEGYVPVDREDCRLLIWKSLAGGQSAEKAIMDFAHYAQNNFQIDIGVATVFAPLEGERLPRAARRLVTLLHEQRYFDHLALSLNERGDYVNERLEALKKSFALVLPICADNPEMVSLKAMLDRYPGPLEDRFERVLRHAAPLLEALRLSRSQPALWEMTRRVCERAEERLDRVTSGIRPQIREAMAYIQEHLAESVTREQLGRLVSYEGIYFSKLFKTETGMGYTEYLLQARMLRARELILETDASLNDIAVMCGFSNYSYFSQRFRQYYGVAPHEWRKNNGEATV